MDIGICFNCDWRNNGTATYCHVALRQLAAERGWTVQHFRPAGEAPKKDWWLYVDDGRDDLTWLPPHPWGYWAVDTHIGYGYRLWKAKQADRVFVAQKPAVEDFERDGAKNVEWLPLACHPEAHPNRQELLAKGFHSDDLLESWDWAFVGFFPSGNGDGRNDRIEYLDRLQREIPNGWITPGAFFEDMAVRYVKARLGFNVSIKRDLNMRIFEVLSTGVPLLTNRDVDGLSDFFEEGIHFLGYEGYENMVERARWALGSPVAREAIAAAGFKEVRMKHTYRHRMAKIVEIMSHA